MCRVMFRSATLFNGLWEQIALDRIPELAHHPLLPTKHPLFPTKAPSLTGSLCFMVFPCTVREGLFTVVENLVSAFMTLGKFFVHCKLQFPHLKGEHNNSTLIGLNSTLIGLRGLDGGGEQCSHHIVWQTVITR